MHSLYVAKKNRMNSIEAKAALKTATTTNNSYLPDRPSQQRFILLLPVPTESIAESCSGLTASFSDVVSLQPQLAIMILQPSCVDAS